MKKGNLSCAALSGLVPIGKVFSVKECMILRVEKRRRAHVRLIFPKISQ